MIASRFWVLGTGAWDASDTTHWAASSGGAGGQSVPGSGDTVTFDGSSGGGTVTVNTTVNVTAIGMGAFTGTLDFATNDNNVTLQTFSGTGIGARTLNMGDGTWTITGGSWNNITATNFTLNANGSTLNFTSTAAARITFTGNASLTYNNITVGAAGANGYDFLFNLATTVAGTLTITGPRLVTFAGATTTIAAINCTGSSSSPVAFSSSTVNSPATISVASGSPAFSWTTFRDITCSGGATFAATNSLDLGRNSGITITPPSVGGGGGYVIGS
ncbi:hypothetical protein [Bradyrhizobium sp. AUGA SZCCT0182]|uniref:hypothetical protein n=1 Tax=Bradyrhizobium sp. AUGA SZCCT0182 TaxID=2807667 RepID=UPI001BABF308|nr:hypothetical protein [Bradyrhizobium sp. AUGA SZCCT0182]MBR1231972.1 hypothetical protein [Bradyrhizobium sp. AUGA SZCCT0182]